MDRHFFQAYLNELFSQHCTRKTGKSKSIEFVICSFEHTFFILLLLGLSDTPHSRIFLLCRDMIHYNLSNEIPSRKPHRLLYSSRHVPGLATCCHTYPKAELINDQCWCIIHSYSQWNIKSRDNKDLTFGTHIGSYIAYRTCQIWIVGQIIDIFSMVFLPITTNRHWNIVSDQYTLINFKCMGIFLCNIFIWELIGHSWSYRFCAQYQILDLVLRQLQCGQTWQILQCRAGHTLEQ